MSNIMYNTLLAVIPAVVTGLLSYILTKRKYHTEVDGKIINNMKDSLDFYETLSTDNKKRLEELVKDNEELRDNIDTLISDNNVLRAEIISLKTQIKTLKTSLDSYTKMLKNGTKNT